MRTTLNIADDVLFAAKDRARREKKTVGEIISDLARRALTGIPSDPPRSESFFGFEPIPPGGTPVTNELINQIREEEGI